MKAQLWPFTRYNWLFLWDEIHSINGVFLVLITDSHGHVSASTYQFTLLIIAIIHPMAWSNPATGGPHSAAHVRPPRLGRQMSALRKWKNLGIIKRYVCHCLPPKTRNKTAIFFEIIHHHIYIYNVCMHIYICSCSIIYQIKLL